MKWTKEKPQLCYAIDGERAWLDDLGEPRYERLIGETSWVGCDPSDLSDDFYTSLSFAVQHTEFVSHGY